MVFCLFFFKKGWFYAFPTREKILLYPPPSSYTPLIFFDKFDPAPYLLVKIYLIPENFHLSMYDMDKDVSLTMSDFHDFGLTWKCQKIFPCGCTITSKTKINIVWNFFYTPGTLCSKKIQTTLILAFGANSAFVSKKWDQNCESCS